MWVGWQANLFSVLFPEFCCAKSKQWFCSFALLCLVFSCFGCATQKEPGYQRVQNIPVGKYKNPIELNTKAGDTLRGEQVFRDKFEIAIQLFGEESSLTFALDKVKSVKPLEVYSMVWVEPKQKVPSRWRLLPSPCPPDACARRTDMFERSGPSFAGCGATCT